MPYCPKCGSEVKEEMTFCPKCGATLKVTATRPAERYRSEKAKIEEKHEKHEKDEKEEKMEKGEHPEKYEKQEYSVFGSLFGGFILIFLGIMFYLTVTGAITFRSVFPFFLIIVGAIVILGVIIGAMRAKGKHPRP